ncbi:MAG TPA: sensor histidine kinase, partial [Acidobacteriaceae bacterium]|nr:sensor histidine kinase [Acidobacteriaceae bacterium]
DAAKQLDTTREYVREGLADARQSIWALRTHDSRDATLPVKLRRRVEHAGSADLASRFSVFGAYRPLSAAKERELLRVAQEAIQNVKKHADASELLVRLEYGHEMIVLEVRDNGRGGAVSEESGFAPGHFGMTGMQERAAAIGGTLEIESEPGRGTTIRLRVPASAAARESDGEPR